ncbi:SHOCT domain-containing protein [Bacillus rhizoplanae]|uniref:SHOCT domain-containing protein n=1 Tax=Bacillus rhizoplanae TaxID=2880966 RepID=UPI003D1BEF85
MMNGNMMDGSFNCFSGGGWMMMGGMALFWILILVLLFVGINSLIKIWHQKSVGYSAVEVLDMRLAKGEISIEEYDRMKQKLK